MRGEIIRKIIAYSIPKGLRKFVPKFLSQHLHFKGNFPVELGDKRVLMLNANGFVLENEIFFYGIRGGHEKRSMKVWLEFCEKYQPNQVYDIGANTGIYGLVAKSLVPNCHVSFFEPIARAVQILNQNLKLNNFNASVFQLALSNYDGLGHYFLEDNTDFAYSVTLNSHADLAITGVHQESISHSKVLTPVRRVSTLLDDGLLEKPNLVKIDVETHESEVLEGFGFELAEVSAYLVEVLNHDAAEKLNALFEELPYHFYHIDDSNDRVEKTDRIYASLNYNYFIVDPTLARNMQSLK